MISMKIVKWALSGAMALAIVPAVGFARHASHVSAVPVSLSAVTAATPAVAKSTSSTKLVSTSKKTKTAGKHRSSRHHKKHGKLHNTGHKAKRLSSKTHRAA